MLKRFEDWIFGLTFQQIGTMVNNQPLSRRPRAYLPTGGLLIVLLLISGLNVEATSASPTRNRAFYPSTLTVSQLFLPSPTARSLDPLTTSQRNRDGGAPNNNRSLLDVVADIRGGDTNNLRGGVFGGDAAASAALPLLALTTIDYTSLIEGAYGWCGDLGAPSALVAGAVVATLYDNMHSGDLEMSDSDSRLVRFGKIVTRLLLLSAFAMETLSIFVTTVTGTMLLSLTVEQMSISDAVIHTPLEFLKENFEFEFLTARIMFLQGLLNWLAAIGLGHILPSPGDFASPTEVALNKFIACSMGTLIVLMVSFFNTHSTFYANYLAMLTRWFYVMMHGHVFGIGTWPPRPLSFVLVPSMLFSFYWGYRALWPTDAPPAGKNETTRRKA